MKIHSQLTSRQFNSPLLINLILLVTAILSLVFISANEDVSAVSVNDFKAGNIISDSVFYNKNSMTVQQIQSFLNNQIGSCDTWGTGKATEWGSNLSRADFARSNGWHEPPYVCLNNYHENPTTKENSYTRGGGYFPGSISAAQIIFNASQQYSINPQVLLTMLKKESAGPLTDDKWPLKNQYTYAMGWGCPDSGPGYSANCNDSRAGFYNQIMTAAWQFNYYRENPNSYRYKLGWNDIQYAPDPACGTKRVHIDNIATLSLYIYTPYTPNDASLNNYPGTANCGSYGNRNFFMFFAEWFGTGERWTNMVIPRDLEAIKDTHKIDVTTNQRVQSIPQGLVRNYPTKTTLGDGNECLRTEIDTRLNNDTCIPLSDLNDWVPPKHEWISLLQPRKLVINNNTNSINPVTSGKVSSVKSHNVYTFTTKTRLKDGRECLRTEAETKRGGEVCIPLVDLVEWNPSTKSSNLLAPRVLITPSSTPIIDSVSGETIGSIPANEVIPYTLKFTINDTINCLVVSHNETRGCVMFSHLSEWNHSINSSSWSPMVIPRELKVKYETYKINPSNGHITQKLENGLTRKYLSKVVLRNGHQCLRTEVDTRFNHNTCVLFRDLAEN